VRTRVVSWNDAAEMNEGPYFVASFA
jgi:hypothetical protein